jgi:pimeloyl-ACP methyl ester carboxylesterase
MVKIDKVIGKYVHLTVQDVEYRVFYEESGQGIPMICQHGGGGDGLEWRHMLNDSDITSKYRVIVPDLPYHGKSLPPESVEWWKQEYQLTKNFLFDFYLELMRVLMFERPVFIGNALGGFLALDLACEFPDEFRAVIGVNSALKAGQSTRDTFNHPCVTNDYRRTNAMYFCGPASPEKYRRECTWCAMMSPPVTKGDLYYYFKEHDLTGKTKLIDTSKCAVYLLTGEYNPTKSIEDTKRVSEQVKGSKFTEMKGMSHAGMPENPLAFKKYLMPILNEIVEKSKK